MTQAYVTEDFERTFRCSELWVSVLKRDALLNSFNHGCVVVLRDGKQESNAPNRISLLLTSPIANQ